MSSLHHHAHRTLWDKLGIAASTVCLVHCLALPLLIPLLPALALVGHGELHSLMLLPLVALTGLAIVPGYLRHRAKPVLGTALAGMAACLAAVLAEALFHVHEFDQPLTVTGSLLLVTAHLMNLRRARQPACGDGCAA